MNFKCKDSSQVKLNLLILEGVKDDLDFCMKLAKEESVIVLPGNSDFIRGFYFFAAAAIIRKIDFVIDPTHLLTVQAGNTAGIAVGMKNWLRVTIAVEPPTLKEGLGRIKDFYKRHAKAQ